MRCGKAGRHGKAMTRLAPRCGDFTGLIFDFGSRCGQDDLEFERLSKTIQSVMLKRLNDASCADWLARRARRKKDREPDHLDNSGETAANL